jgi:hypothetical protein
VWSGHRKQGLSGPGDCDNLLGPARRRQPVAQPQAEIRLQRLGRPGSEACRAPKDESLLPMPSSPGRTSAGPATARDPLPRLCRRERAGRVATATRRRARLPADPRLPTERCGHRRQGPPPSPGDCDDLVGPERFRLRAALHLEADVRRQRPDWMDPSMHRASPNDEPISSANGSVATWPCFRCPHRSAGRPRNLAAARDPPGKGKEGGTDGAPRRPA